MNNSIFTQLLTRQINQFVATFQEDSNVFFKDESNQFIHPGEYGMYREQCFSNLLKLILPRNYEVSDGFIISSVENHISTQCDVLIKNAMAMPLTEGGLGKFHPVEDIYCVIEMKSDLSKSDLTKALRKLAAVKMLSDDRRNKGSYQETRFLNHDCIPSFLVCNKFKDFSLEKLNFNTVYEGIARKYWHNAILSLEDGVFIYRLPLNELPQKTKEHYKNKGFNTDFGSCTYQYSEHIFYFSEGTEYYECNPKFLKARPEDKLFHIKMFLAALKQAVDETVKYEFDCIEYLGLRSTSLNI